MTYFIEETTLTSIANKVRLLEGTDGKISCQDILAILQEVIDEVEIQKRLIEQAAAELNSHINGGAGDEPDDPTEGYTDAILGKCVLGQTILGGGQGLIKLTAPVIYLDEAGEKLATPVIYLDEAGEKLAAPVIYLDEFGEVKLVAPVIYLDEVGEVKLAKPIIYIEY